MSTQVPDFVELLGSARTSAAHLEMRDAYAVADEAEEFALWRRTGKRWEGERAEQYWRPWVDLVRATVARGVRMRRARVVSEPVSEYIEFEHAGTSWNVDAGEEVRWLPRRRAVDLLLPGCDLWLIDDRIVRFNVFDGDGDVVEPEFSEDPDVAKQCAAAFEAVWERAVPHAEYRV
ncbi:DUF6879 family protein [Streptantibioticus parmotrematis]|uniref:DUF6879 family protein n=1 Tax=Streptantibioticus parmotrematis TaxID=2873249 RepID=UPI0033D181AC